MIIATIFLCLIIFIMLAVYGLIIWECWPILVNQAPRKKSTSWKKLKSIEKNLKKGEKSYAYHE